MIAARTTRQSCADILRRSCNLHLRPGPRTVTERLEPVRRLLLGLVPNAPPSEPPGKLLIDPGCPRVKDALRSGYHYKQLPGAQGRYHDVPEKNAFSHLADALAYALAHVDEETRPSEPQEPIEWNAGQVLGAFPPRAGDAWPWSRRRR